MGRERREWGASSLLMVVVWGGGRGVMVDVDVIDVQHSSCDVLRVS